MQFWATSAGVRKRGDLDQVHGPNAGSEIVETLHEPDLTGPTATFCPRRGARLCEPQRVDNKAGSTCRRSRLQATLRRVKDPRSDLFFRYALSGLFLRSGLAFPSAPSSFDSKWNLCIRRCMSGANRRPAVVMKTIPLNNA